MGYKLTYADLDVWLRPTIKANSFEHNPLPEQYEEPATTKPFHMNLRRSHEAIAPFSCNEAAAEDIERVRGRRRSALSRTQLRKLQRADEIERFVIYWGRVEAAHEKRTAYRQLLVTV
jgi:hypothetical protein